MQKISWEATKHEGEKGFWAGFEKLCKGCGLCIEKCPKKSLSWSEELGVYGTPRVKPDMNLCVACGICDTVCPDCAILVRKYDKDN